MSVEVKIPQVGESITDVEVGEWLVKEGDYVELDAPVVVIETDKATVEVPAPAAGVLVKQLKATGAEATVGEVIGSIEEGEKGESKQSEQGAEESKQEATKSKDEGSEPKADSDDSEDSGEQEAKDVSKASSETKNESEESSPSERIMPAARRLLEEHDLKADQIPATGPGGRLLKEDVLLFLKRREDPKPEQSAAPSAAASNGNRQEEAVPMTRFRRKIAERLVDAQQTAALLTTFNEIDMSAVINLRAQYKESFEKKHGIKLGFMSFFVKASIEALKEFPRVNAEIRDKEIIYKNYFDVGIAVGGGKGLVVPILRNAENMAFSDVEKTISDFGRRAKDNQIQLQELQGGTFTISNGGIYGSLLSTPIVNPPQSGILGLHAIQKRAVVVDDEIVIRPMMYVALTYDHRIIDGREAVTFLKRIKECIEDPSRILLEV